MFQLHLVKHIKKAFTQDPFIDNPLVSINHRTTKMSHSENNLYFMYIHRVSIQQKCPYMKNLKGKVTSPRTLTIMTSHTNKCQILVLNLTQKNESCEKDQLKPQSKYRKKCLYMEKLKGEGNFPSYFDNNDITYI